MMPAFAVRSLRLKRAKRSWSKWKNACEAWKTCSLVVSCGWHVFLPILLQERFSF